VSEFRHALVNGNQPFLRGTMLCHCDLVSGDSWSSKYYPDDQFKKNEMVGACGTYGGKERCIRSFGGKTWRMETTLTTLRGWY